MINLEFVPLAPLRGAFAGALTLTPHYSGCALLLISGEVVVDSIWAAHKASIKVGSSSTAYFAAQVAQKKV